MSLIKIIVHWNILLFLEVVQGCAPSSCSWMKLGSESPWFPHLCSLRDGWIEASTFPLCVMNIKEPETFSLIYLFWCLKTVSKWVYLWVHMCVQGLGHSVKMWAENCIATIKHQIAYFSNRATFLTISYFQRMWVKMKALWWRQHNALIRSQWLSHWMTHTIDMRCKILDKGQKKRLRTIEILPTMQLESECIPCSQCNN